MNSHVDAYESRYLALSDQVRQQRGAVDEVLSRLTELPGLMAEADASECEQLRREYERLVPRRDALLADLEGMLYQRDLAHRAWLSEYEERSESALDQFRREVYKPSREAYENARRSLWLARACVNVGDGRDLEQGELTAARVADCEVALANQKEGFLAVRERWHELQLAAEYAMLHRRRLERVLSYL